MIQKLFFLTYFYNDPIFILVFSFLKSRNINNQQTGSTSTTQEETYENGVPKAYTVKEGDDLWTVSEKIYGSGYNWVDIAEANKLENPEVLFVGSKLNVPNVEKKEIVSEEQTDKTNPITGISYNVKEGDSLWDIAVRSYGDGYKWVEISRVNKLVNPNIIHPGNILQLPR